MNDQRINDTGDVKYTECVFGKIDVEYLRGTIKKLAIKNGKEGIYPFERKEVILVIPVPNVRETNKIEKYRPINKLFVCKNILEMVIQNSLLNIWKK